MRIFELLHGKTLKEVSPAAGGPQRSFRDLGSFGGGQDEPPQRQPQMPPMQDGQPVQGAMNQPQPQPLVSQQPIDDMNQMAMPNQPPQQGSEFAAADPNNSMVRAQQMAGNRPVSGREATSLQPTSVPRPQA